MRIYADINRLGVDPRDYVIQVCPTPEIGANATVNGKFFIDVPNGVAVPTIPATLGSLTDSIFNGLLALHTTCSFVKYNALLTGSDSNLLDSAATFPFDPGPPVQTWSARAQLGRFGAPSDNGLAANSVRIHSQNSSVIPARPGLLITDTIDVSADVPAGVTKFSVYWNVVRFTTSPDILNSAPGGTNSPSLRQSLETGPEPADFEVHASTNDGAGYAQVRHMVPCTSLAAGTDLRLAFINKGSNNLYLTAYAVLY